jgi:hypothetical protein
VLVTLAVGLLGALPAYLVLVRPGGGQSQGSQRPVVANTTLGQPAAASATATTSGSPQQTQPSTDTVVGSPNNAPQDLGDAVTWENCGNFGWGNPGPVRIAGTDYPSSLIVTCYLNAQVVWMDFLVPSGSTLLTGVVGIGDHSPETNGKAMFTVLDASRKPLVASKTLSYGQSWSLAVPVKGVARIRLQVQYINRAGGDFITACWANMQFTA